MLSMIILNETIRVDLVVFLAIFAEYINFISRKNIPLTGFVPAALQLLPLRTITLHLNANLSIGSFPKYG